MPFFNNIYYPYQADSQGAQTSVGIPSLLNSPQSQQSSNSQQAGSVATMSTTSQASAAVPLPPFRFRSRHESVDWRRISALDVDRVATELDFQTLQEHIAGVTFCNLEAERCQRCQTPVDATLIKLFRMAQLTVEYLLHSQDYLSLSLQAAEERVQAEQREREQMHLTLQKHAEEMKTFKDELKQRKKIITSQQAMISTGIAGYHKCQHCDKAFMNATFLHSHMQRRHPDECDIKPLTDAQKKVQKSVCFQEEINRLKEQLSLTRSQVETQQQACVAKTTQERDLNEKQEELKRDLEKWKADELKTMNRQIDEIRDSCQRDVNSLYEKNSVLEKQLAKVQETNRMLVAKIEKEKQGTTHKEKKRRTTHPNTADGGAHMPGVQHQQDILKLEHQLQTQDEKWAARLLKIQKEHEIVKNQLTEDLQHLQKCLNEQNWRQKEQPDDQLLKQGQDLRYQPQQVKQVPSSPPTTAVKRDAAVPEPKSKPVVHDSSSISDKKTVVCEVVERVKEFMKNPAAKREMREIVEQTLEEELHSLGIKPRKQGLTKEEYNHVMMEVLQKRRELLKDSPQCQRLRVELSHSLDQRVKDRLACCTSVPVKQRRARDTPVALPRTMSSSLPLKGSQLITDVPARQTPQASCRSSTKAKPNTSTPKTHPFSSDDDSEEGPVPPSLNGSVGKSQPMPVPRGGVPQVVVCKERPGSLVENDGLWTEGSELEEIEPKQLQDLSPLNSSTSGKKAHGHHVKELTRNLENQLAGQRPPRIAGSINLINSADPSVSKMKGAVEDPKYTVNVSRDEDDDDWDISSLDDDSKPTSSLNVVQKTLDSTSTSVWGPSTGHSPKPAGLRDAGTGSTLKSSLVSFSDWSSSEDE